MACGQLPLGGCANSDLAHFGKCTPWEGDCRVCGPVSGVCDHSDDPTSRKSLRQPRERGRA